MKPENLKTQIFLDSGNPVDTQEVVSLLGFLDGQTTNPSLIAKSPEAVERLASGNKFSKDEIYDFYKKTIQDIRAALPTGPIAVEVPCDENTTAEEMVAEGEKMNQWISGASIKLPTNHEGLRAARMLVDRGMGVTMTLVFTQEQAAAVYAATTGAKKGQVLLVPFVGRLDDIGLNGMDLIANINEMYKAGDGHVEVVAVSVRTLDHFLSSIALGTDGVSAPTSVLKEWAEKGMTVPTENTYHPALASIAFETVDLIKPWEEYNIAHELTTKGIEKFVADWNKLLA